MTQKYRIYVKEFRPNETENSFFGMLDEKIMLDYEAYFFHNLFGIFSLDDARKQFKYVKACVYRNGNIAWFINNGEQPLPL